MAARLRPAPGAEHDQAGFTLIELLIVVLLLPLIMGAVAEVIITSLNDDTGVATKLAESHDAQMTSAFFVRDVQSAMVLTTASTPLCGTGTEVLGIAWQPTAGTTSYVSYVTTTVGSSAALVRRYCSGSTTTPSTVSHDLSSAAGAASVTPSCAPAYPSCSPSTALVPAVQVASVHIQVVEQSGYTFGLQASPRLFSSAVSGTPPGASSPSLLLLGSGAGVGSCSGSGGPLDVNGLAAVDSSSPGALSFAGSNTLSAEQVYSENSATSGASAPVQPPTAYTATTSQAYSSGPAIPDPYAGLPDPSTTGLQTYTTTSTLPGPGVYSNPVTITASTTITGGTYVFEGGLSVQGGGSSGGTTSLTSNGASVLFFIGIPAPPAWPTTPQPAAYSVTGQAAVNLTGMTSGTYAGLVLFQSRSDSNSLAVAGNGTTSFYGGAIYAPDATVNTSGNGTTYSSAIIADGLACGGNGTTSLGASIVPTSTVVTSPATTEPSGQPVTFTATVSGSNGLTPAGTVTFSEQPNGGSASAMCSSVTLANGQATCTSPALSATGSPYTITATYSGNNTFASSTGTLSQAVGVAPTSVGVSAQPAHPGTNGTVTLTAAVSPAPDAGTVTWTITYGTGGTVTCNSTTALASGTATCTVSAGVLQAANSPYTVTAAYGGDANYGASSGQLALTVGKGSSTTTGRPSATTLSLSGSPRTVTDTATVAGVGAVAGSATPSGTVTFYLCTFNSNSANNSCSSSAGALFDTETLANGQATSVTFTPANKGNYCFAVYYQGDVNYGTSADVTNDQCFTVGK